VVNEKCPITGNKLDREKVPADLRREFKGKPVGFCCKNCPPAWDKLTDEQKQAKLDKVRQQLEALQKENRQLKERLKKLEDALAPAR